MKQNSLFLPKNVSSHLCYKKIVKFDRKLDISERLSTRMTRSAAVIGREDFLGWQLYVPRKKGLADIRIFSSDGVGKEDLEWMSAIVAVTSEKQPAFSEAAFNGLSELYELYLPVRETPKERKIGFASSDRPAERTADADDERGMFGNGWPTVYSNQFAELANSFSVTGACFRAVLGSAGEEERLECRKTYLQSEPLTKIAPDDYLGKPVRAKFLIRLPGKPSLCMRPVP